MKKRLGKFLLVLIVCLLIIALPIIIFTVAVKNELTDKLNPFLPETDIFVQINKLGKELDTGDYEYSLTGYDKSGEKHEVTFTASKQLRETAYLKVITKRTYVDSWKEVQFKELPSKVRAKFE
ncbi:MULTISPECIES: YxeA family protein [Clostridia]|uniref:YxeA family protein n=1 Tax=Clostridia TaxID=186801 RepID=UPI000EA1E919|nr:MULTISPECIES: YxeA family protein [Clostridia]NBJ69029.1 YxeA family protein [Roseburia sp. 1XD42-34]RKI79930.1 YxeA family protein [Clostridium sp. 1xD42-85]